MHNKSSYFHFFLAVTRTKRIKGNGGRYIKKTTTSAKEREKWEHRKLEGQAKTLGQKVKDFAKDFGWQTFVILISPDGKVIRKEGTRL